MLRKPLLALIAIALAAAPSMAQTTCTASSSWINDPTLPASLDESNHCNFAIFSWQSFLALTETSDASTGQLLFETYMDTDGLFPADGTSPTPWGSEPWPLTLSDITQQAGSGNDLVAQNGNEVQYDMSVNETMYDYITTNMLYNATCFNAGVANKSIHMPPTVSTDTTDESIELKSAWLPMTSCDPTKYYCTKAVINGGAPQPVALIGIHIVHKLPDHQEWIWSSFEHVANAPDCSNVTSPPSGFSSWNFFKTGFVNTGSACTPCPNDGTTCPSTQCNVFVSENQVPNICRVQPLTTVACDTTNTNLDDDTNDVACLNASVQSLLGSSVWSNYMLVGTIWFKPGMSAPDSSGQTPPSGQAFVGNLTLSNSVMETYTQSADQNCFGCHTNTFKAFNASSAENSGHADFSHIFNRIQAVKPVTCPTISSQASHGKKKAAAAPAPIKPVRSHESYGQKKDQ